MNSIDQKFIGLDLEMNQPSGRIIQVGVSIGARAQADVDYVTRQWLLSPQEPLNPKIIELTGITEESLSLHAVSWQQMSTELNKLIELHKPFINPITWGGGDSAELLESLKGRGIEFKQFGRRWIDVKTFHSMTMLAMDKNPSGGLRSIMGKYGLAFKGTPHRADVDAFNTLRLFFRLINRQSAFENMAALAKAA